MKNPHFFNRLGLAVSCHFAFGLAAYAAHIDFDTSAIHESFDRNPLGEMVDQPSGGYGVTGNYIYQGNSVDIAKQSFQVVAGGLPFANYNTSAGRSVSVDAWEATGVGIQVDGGKAWGDTDFHRFDTLYCSYLINFSQAANTSSSRALVRTSTADRGGDQFQVEADGAGITDAGTGTTNSLIQPSLAYKGTTYDRAQNPATNALKLNKTYMIIGRFDNAGNILSVTPTGTWTAGDRTILVNNNANLQVGQYVTGNGIAPNSIVTGITNVPNTSPVQANVTLSQPTNASGSATALNFAIIRNEVSDALANWTIPTAGATSTEITLIDSPTYPIKVGMVVTGTGIPANTTITNINTTSGTKITINAAVTSTVSSGLLTFRSVAPLTGSWSSGSNTITMSMLPQNSVVKAGDTISGAGIPTLTFVQSVSGNVITLTKATTAAGAAGTPVYINERTARCSLYALTEAQYNHMISLSTQDAKENFLDTAPMGDTEGNPQQVAVRIVGTPTSTGSIEFGQGRYVHLIAAGASNSHQKYKLDEVRFGFTLRSVTQPAAALPVPLDDPAAFDDGTKRSWYGYDNGYGWKSGYFIVEETAATQGAQLYNIVGSDISGALSPGGGDYIWIQPREGTNNDQGTRRRPDPAVVDMTKPYTVSFDFQLKSGYQTFTAFEDRIQFGADSQLSAAGVPVAGSNLGPNPTRPNIPTAGGDAISWMAGVIGGQSTGRNIFPGRWYFYDYNGAFLEGSSPPNYFVGGNMVLASDDATAENRIPPINAGDPVDPQVTGGGIYSFKFEVNPQTYTYRGTISYRVSTTGNIVRTFSKGGLKFRDNYDSTTLFWGISKSTGENRIFALDNVRVAQGVDFFPEWVGSFDTITGSEKRQRSADADNDGRKNFLEYALDGDPASPTGNPKEIQGITTISASQYHTLTVPIRSGFTFSAAAAPNTGDLESTYTKNEGIKYRIEGSYDLVNWDATVVEISPSLTGAPTLSASPGYEYKSFRLGQPISPSHPKGFLRVVVESTK